MHYNVATSLALVSGFLLDMDPIKVSREPDELKHKSHFVPAYLRHVRFTNDFLVWFLFIDGTKLSELGNARLKAPGVSSELQWGWSNTILFCILLLELHAWYKARWCASFFPYIVHPFSRNGESINWLAVCQMLQRWWVKFNECHCTLKNYRQWRTIPGGHTFRLAIDKCQSKPPVPR